MTLNPLTHDNPDLHYIGASITPPSAVQNVGQDISSSIGVSPFPAREDHVHGSVSPSFHTLNSSDVTCKQNNTSVNYTFRDGFWIKRDGLCHVHFVGTITANGTANTEFKVTISGAPNIANFFSGVTSGLFRFAYSTGGHAVGAVYYNGTDFRFFADGANNYFGISPNYQVVNNDEISFTVEYRFA